MEKIRASDKCTVMLMRVSQQSENRTQGTLVEGKYFQDYANK